MSQRDAFLRAIIAEPDDDTTRLVFADWLEEHGEADLAEFIRVQCELEPLRRDHALERANQLRSREAKLHHCFQAQVQPLQALFGQSWWNVGVQVRRGFPHVLEVMAAIFLSHAADILPACPMLRRLRLFCVNGYAARLADCEYLRGWPELELACWYTPAEAERLAASPHLQQLETLTIWLGGATWEGAIGSEDLVRLFAAAPAWPKLRRLILFDPEVGQRSDALVPIADEAAGRPLARIVRPRDGRLPFAPTFKYFCPGTLPDGRRVVARPIIGDRIHVIVFGDDDHVAEEYSLPQTEEVRALVASERGLHGAPPEFRAAIHSAVGSAPAFIRVFPFCWPDGECTPVDGPDYHYETWSALGLPDEPDREGWYQGRVNGHGGDISWIVETGQYGCGDGWCDECGEVHST